MSTQDGYIGLFQVVPTSTDYSVPVISGTGINLNISEQYGSAFISVSNVNVITGNISSVQIERKLGNAGAFVSFSYTVHSAWMTGNLDFLIYDPPNGDFILDGETYVYKNVTYSIGEHPAQTLINLVRASKAQLDSYYYIDLVEDRIIFTRKNASVENEFGNLDGITGDIGSVYTREDIPIEFSGGMETEYNDWEIIENFIFATPWSVGNHSMTTDFVTNKIIKDTTLANEFRISFFDEYNIIATDNILFESVYVTASKFFDGINDIGESSLFNEYAGVHDLHCTHPSIDDYGNTVTTGVVKFMGINNIQMAIGDLYGEVELTWKDMNTIDQEVEIYYPEESGGEQLHNPINKYYLSRPLEYIVCMYLSNIELGLSQFPADIKKYPTSGSNYAWVYVGLTKENKIRCKLPGGFPVTFWVGFGDTNTKITSNIFQKLRFNLQSVISEFTPVKYPVMIEVPSDVL